MTAKLPVLKSLEDFLIGHYDYIIVGGGNSGLPVAARLSEDPDINVAVIEAGDDKIGDPKVQTPAAFQSLLDNDEYDWNFKTVPQAGIGHISHSWSRGKLLGGCTGINYMMYARGQVQEYNDWKKFTELEGFSFKKEHHGIHGPIKTSFPSFRAPIETSYHETAGNAGLIKPRDAWSGNRHGVYSNLSTIDRTGLGTRSYAVTGYLVPSSDRPNLAVLTNALVEKVIFREGGEDPIAEGVVFSYDNKRYKLISKIATVISAGVVMIPQLLELSGIGSHSILSKLNIRCVFDNPRVGDLEDHVVSGLTWDLHDGQFSLDQLHIPESQAKQVETYAAGKPGPMNVASQQEMNETYRIIQSYRETLKNDHEYGHLLLLRSDLLLSRLQDPNAAIFQIIALATNINFGGRHDMREFLAASPDTSRFSICVGLHQCFSRGSIHIQSSDPRKQPAIDLQILNHPVDKLLLAYAIRIIAKKIGDMHPLQQSLKGRVRPAPEVNLDDLDAAVEYVKGHTGTEFHPVATASLGTVVDNRLNVKGVKGLKVCDASIIPLHISGNAQGPCYAIGEKGPDLFKEDAEADARK